MTEVAKRGDLITIEICRSHTNADKNPFIGIIREGNFTNMVTIFDKYDPNSLTLEPGRFASARILHVLPKCLIVRFQAYAQGPIASSVVEKE